MEQLFAPIERTKAYEEVALAIQDRILKGVLKPGDRLPTEMALAEQFGVSRSTCREALRVVQMAGLLESRPGSTRGLYVASYDSANLARSMHMMIEFQKVTFDELFEMLLVLEPLSAQLAAQRATEFDLAEIVKNIEETRASLDSPQRILELDLAFHDLVAHGTRNSLLFASRRALRMTLEPAGKTAIQSREISELLLHAHEKIFAAIGDRNAEVAHRRMLKHCDAFREAYRQHQNSLDKPLFPLFDSPSP